MARLVRAALLLALPLALLVATTLVAPREAAAAQTCAGRDLRPDIEAARPGALAEMEAMAAMNGDARLWRVTAPNGAVSYLYGTMHVTDPAVVALGPEAREAYEAAALVVIETLDLLDPQKASASLMARPDLMFFTDGRDLTDLIPDEDEAVLDAALAARGMSLAAVRTLKPWVLAAQLSLPACMADGSDILDLDLARRAREGGREVAGLETAVEQMEALASVPLDLHVASLVQSAALGEAMDDVFATMGLLYAEGRIGQIWPLLNAMAMHVGAEAPTEGELADAAAFEEIVVTRRNRLMAERSDPLLRGGGAFLAVGALHLPGEEGLVELLRGRGFAVERVAP